MKIGDKVTMLVHGAGVTSKEECIIENIDGNYLIIEGSDEVFYKTDRGDYKTPRSSFGFWFEIKGRGK